MDAVDSEFSSILVKCLSVHIPGWSEEWQKLFKTHQMLPTYLLEAYKSTNEMRLSKIPSLNGAHKSQEALETVPLGTFLMKRFLGDDLSEVEFCLKTSDMPGLARLAANNVSVALENMAIIIELADVGNSININLVTFI